MYRSIFSILSISLAYFTASTTAASSDCLRQTGTPADSPTYSTFSVVEASCDEYLKSDNRTCIIQRITEEVELSRSLNITTTPNITADIFDTFAKSFNVSFNDIQHTFVNISGLVNVTSNQVNSTAGDVPQLSGNIFGGRVFTQRCYTGEIVKDCFNGISIGTSIEACRPFIPDNAIANEPSDLEDEVVRPGEMVTPTPTGVPTPTASPLNGGATNLLGHSGWQSSLLMVTMGLTIMKIGNYFVVF